MAKPRQLKSGHWRIRWMDASGQRRSATFLTYAEAVDEHALRVAEVKLTKAGRFGQPIIERTFADLAKYWQEYRVPQKRSGRHDVSIMNRHLLPSFGRFLLREIGPAQIHRFQLDRKSLRPKTVHNHLTLLKSMLELAVDLGWLNRCPRIDKPKINQNEEEYGYLRTDGEIRQLLEAAKEEGQLAYLLYLTAIFTGLRAGELAGLRWSDLDFDKRVICVQRSYDRMTKSGRIRYVPMLNEVFTALMRWRRQNDSLFVFPKRDGGMLQPSARIFQEVLHRVLIRAGFEPSFRRGRIKPYITFHELRHTFGSHWMMRGGDIYQLQKIMGHSTVQVTERYAHLSATVFDGVRHIFEGVLRPL